MHTLKGFKKNKKKISNLGPPKNCRFLKEFGFRLLLIKNTSD
jgi:hypothetical protein